jgi:hypothetical protein
VSHLGNGLKVRDIVSGVADALDVDSLGLLVNSGGDVFDLVAGNELGGDAEALEGDLELVVGTAVKVAGRDDVVASLGEGRNGNELSSLARGGGQSSNTALKGSYPLLEDIDGGLDRRVSFVCLSCVMG